VATILVTDGEQRAALAVVRSLGRAGHRVFVCSTRSRPLAGASRYAKATFAVGDPLAYPAAFADEVGRLVECLGVDLLLPVADPSATALLPRREWFLPALIPYPSWESYARISDKACALAAAAAVGIAVPSSTLLSTPAATPPAGLRFPLVIKPSLAIAAASRGRSRLPARYARDAAELAAHVGATPAEAYPLLLQERIVGPGLGVFLLIWDGALVAAFGHRRLREKPPSGGVSVLCQSEALDPGLLARSRALLDRFDWRGVAMVEYKLHSESGMPYLMEVNGRFWGSLQLAADAGVDFPALLVATAQGGPAGPPPDYQVGLRSRWWWGSVDHLIARVRGNGGATGPSSRARVLVDALGLLWPAQSSNVFKSYDPLPFLNETVNWFARR
jgi:predicted ATP-grasp superfamily ATP-dependent carboligase